MKRFKMLSVIFVFENTKLIGYEERYIDSGVIGAFSEQWGCHCMAWGVAMEG